jgi:4-aminobutyrate aminotransferase
MVWYSRCYDEVPKILVPPPGPKSREVIELDDEFIMQSFSRWYPLVVKSGCGPIIEDLDGNLYIDFNSGIGVMNLGHNHPKVVEAIKKQVDKLLHYSLTDFLYEEAVLHAKEFLSIVPIEGRKKVFYCNSGTEGIEGALKIVKGYFRGSRQYVLSFIGAFHGRTLGSLSLSGSKAIHKKYFQPLLPGVIHIPFPDPYRCPLGVEGDECGDVVISYIEDYIFRRLASGDDVAGVFLRFKILGKKVVMYLSFTREFEVSYNPKDVVAVDVNENNVTIAFFKDGVLSDVYRVETGLGRVVIAYSERRERITRGSSTKVREVRRS